jgi:hypothetical protein
MRAVASLAAGSKVEDLGPGDFVKIDCAACHHVALLKPEALVRAGLSPPQGSRPQRTAPWARRAR